MLVAAGTALTFSAAASTVDASDNKDWCKEPGRSRISEHVCIGPEGAIGPAWSHLGVGVDVNVDDIFGGASGGVISHIWDQKWRYSPDVAGGYGKLAFGGRLNKNLILWGDGHIDYDFKSFRSAEVPLYQFSPQALLNYGGTLNLAAANHKNEQLVLGLKFLTSFHETVVPKIVLSDSKKNFDSQLKLVLQDSRPLEKSEIKGFMAEATLGGGIHYADGDDWLFANDASAEVKAAYVFGGGVVEARAKDEIVWGAFPIDGDFEQDAWFEFHLRGTIDAVFPSTTPVFMLPSFGGNYAMLTGFPGDGVNAAVTSIGAQLGTSFLRGFIEYGWSWGVGEATGSLGGGGGLWFPRSPLMAARSRHPIFAIVDTDLGIIIGGNEGRFYTNLQYQSKF